MRHSLVLDGVSKSFGDQKAVRNISAEIPEGSIYGFIGPNGAGKTTTIRMIMSILYPDSGSLAVLGQKPEAVKDLLGYLPEEKGLYKKMKTAELVAYFGRLKGMSGPGARSRAHELLQTFGLGHCADMRCDTLSKGMGQKVQIISTLIHAPELVILDEPFSGLDPINVETVRGVILDLKRQGRTVIFSTHVMEQAEQICDAILLISRGQKLLDGTLAQLKADASPTIVIEYLGTPVNLGNLPGVLRVNDMGRAAELTLSTDADSQQILKLLVSSMTLQKFAFKEPSLHEIFVRTVGASPE
ncbi:MAG: ABC transporter ATP-binding protein [Pseudomonadota bacterium]